MMERKESVDDEDGEEDVDEKAEDIERVNGERDELVVYVKM